MGEREEVWGREKVHRLTGAHIGGTYGPGMAQFSIPMFVDPIESRPYNGLVPSPVPRKHRPELEAVARLPHDHTW